MGLTALAQKPPKTYIEAKPAPKYVHEQLKNTHSFTFMKDEKYVTAKKTPKHIHDQLKKRFTNNHSSSKGKTYQEPGKVSKKIDQEIRKRLLLK